MAKEMFKREGNYYYLAPTYKQGKKIIWNGIDRDGFKFLDHIPKELRERQDSQDMLIEMKNGSTFQVVGTDSIDTIVGTNPVGCVFTEYSLQDPAAWDFIRPVLAENKGWAIFIFTPRGKNHGFQLLKMARQYPDIWFNQVLTVEDTGAISEKALEQEKREIISKDGNDALYQQEYMCSFDVPIQGAYYATQLLMAEEDGRITKVPYDTAAEVHTFWDLGVDDSTTVWFMQIAGREIHFIDYIEDSGEGINYYVKQLKEKPYVYGKHFMPHDIKVRELSTGRSRLETVEGLGMKPVVVVPKLPVEDGINAGRMIFNRCWFDEEKTERGINALRSYTKEWDEKNQVFKNRPRHDWASHGADAFRTFAIGWRDESKVHPVEHVDPVVDPYSY